MPTDSLRVRYATTLLRAGLLTLAASMVGCSATAKMSADVAHGAKPAKDKSDAAPATADAKDGAGTVGLSLSVGDGAGAALADAVIGFDLTIFACQSGFTAHVTSAETLASTRMLQGDRGCKFRFDAISIDSKRYAFSEETGWDAGKSYFGTSGDDGSLQFAVRYGLPEVVQQNTTIYLEYGGVTNDGGNGVLIHGAPVNLVVRALPPFPMHVQSITSRFTGEGPVSFNAVLICNTQMFGAGCASQFRGDFRFNMVYTEETNLEPKRCLELTSDAAGGSRVVNNNNVSNGLQTGQAVPRNLVGGAAAQAKTAFLLIVSAPNGTCLTSVITPRLASF